VNVALKRQSATNGFFTGAADHWAYKNGASADQMVEGASKIGFTAANLIPGSGVVTGPAQTIYDLVKDDAGWTSHAAHSGQKSADHQKADRENNRQQMVVTLAKTGLYDAQDWEAINARLTDSEAQELANPNGMSGMSAADLKNKGGALSDIGNHMANAKQAGLNEIDVSHEGKVDDSYDDGYEAANPETNGSAEPQAELDRNITQDGSVNRPEPRKAPYSSLPDPKGKHSGIAKPGVSKPK